MTLCDHIVNFPWCDLNLSLAFKIRKSTIGLNQERLPGAGRKVRPSLCLTARCKVPEFLERSPSPLCAAGECECAGLESWAEWAGHQAAGQNTPGQGAQPTTTDLPYKELSSRLTTTCNSTPASNCLPADISNPSGDQKWPRVTHRLPQDGLLSAMLLLCQPAHGRADDGSHDSRTQCLLHRSHGDLAQQKVWVRGGLECV